MSQCGEFLEQFRHRHSLQQKEMAARFNISQSLLSHILSGKKYKATNRGIEIATLQKILTGLPSEDRALFVTAYLKDVLDKRFYPAIPGQRPAESASLLEDAPTFKRASHAIDELIEAIQHSEAPTRVAKQLTALVLKGKGRPEYFEAIQKILDI